MDNVVQKYTFLIGSRDNFKTPEELIQLWKDGPGIGSAWGSEIVITSEEICECSGSENLAWLRGCLKAKSEGWILGGSVMALICLEPGRMRICGTS